MRCAYFGKKVIKEDLGYVQKFCDSNNMDARSLNQSFKNLLVPKEFVYQNSDSTGIIKLILSLIYIIYCLFECL